MPPLVDITLVVEDKETLDLLTGQKSSICCASLPAEYAEPTCLVCQRCPTFQKDETDRSRRKETSGTYTAQTLKPSGTGLQTWAPWMPSLP